jgi:beta-fructofuranosidase
MTLQLDDKWVWDLWLAPEKVAGAWHLYFLQAPRSIGNPDLRHENATVGHAVSFDLMEWEYLGTTLEPGEAGSWDDRAIWTGSIVKDAEGLWYMFYTGTNKSKERGLIQRIGVATSTDLHNWTKVANFVTEADVRWYERFNLDSEEGLHTWYEEAWRDPWVIKHPTDSGWLMLITARKRDGEPDGRGTIGIAVSDDLINWRIKPPLEVGNEFGHFEVPQLLELPDDSWGVTFCLAENNHAQIRKVRGAPIWTGNGIMRASNFEGPWIVDDEPFLRDPHYAARIIEIDQRYLALAWLNYVDGKFQGTIDNPIDVTDLILGNAAAKYLSDIPNEAERV